MSAVLLLLLLLLLLKLIDHSCRWNVPTASLAGHFRKHFHLAVRLALSPSPCLSVCLSACVQLLKIEKPEVKGPEADQAMLVCEGNPPF